MNKTTIVDNQAKENTNSKPTKRMRDDKPRKKDEKSVDHLLKALDGFETTEAKLGAMCQKYAEMFNEHRMLQSAVKQAEKKNTVLQKEKEQLQAEHSKAILTRSRLENLCRELQRQNKAVKEECMLKMREEGEKKREVAAKFHSMLSEIGSLLAQNNDKNAKLRDDNLDMSMRLKSVCDQFEKKEQHVENLAKQMQLEMQLADAKLAKAKMEMDIEKETLQKEKQQLLIELADYKRKLCEMKASELALREQITMYSEKYEEFHSALLQSNSAIGDFKAEMERMTKHIRRLEKETATWKSRYDAAQRTLAEVTQGKIRADEALALSQRRLVALQGICRGLQNQCQQLRGEKRRDSQTDEDYKKLEAQIKEVEQNCRTDELDNRPCPRRVSCEESESKNVETSPSESNVVELNESCCQDSSDSVKINETAEVDTVDAHLNENVESVIPKEDAISDNKLCSNAEEVEIKSQIISLGENIHTEIEEQDKNKTCDGSVDNSNNISAEVNCPATPEKVDSIKNDLEENSQTSVVVSSFNIEDCVNSLVNHIQEVTLLEGNKSTVEIVNATNTVSDDKKTQQTEIKESIKETNVPTPNETDVNNISEQNPTIINESDLPQSTNDIVCNESSSSLNKTINNDVLPTNDVTEVLQSSQNQENDATKITPNSPDEASQTKNKKKRKSKK